MFGACIKNSDPAVHALTDLGYGMVKLPRTAIRPLQIYTKTDSTLHLLGNLATVLHSDTVSLPGIVPGGIAASVSGTRSSGLKLGFGVSLLGTVIGAMGGGVLGLKEQYAQAKAIQFEYRDVEEESIEVALLDQYLTDSDIDPMSTAVRQFMDASRLYVTTSVLRTKKLVVEAKGSDGVGLSLDIPAIQGIVGANVQVGADGAASARLVYEGAVSLAFAFQAYRLFFTNGRFQRLRVVGADVGIAAAAPDGGEDTGQMLPLDDPFYAVSIEP